MWRTIRSIALAPACTVEPVAAADQRMGQSVRAGIGNPGVKSLGTQAAAVDRVRLPPAHADDAATRLIVLDADVDAATVRA